jgi:hypothetical protein
VVLPRDRDRPPHPPRHQRSVDTAPPPINARGSSTLLPTAAAINAVLPTRIRGPSPPPPCNRSAGPQPPWKVVRAVDPNLKSSQIRAPHAAACTRRTPASTAPAVLSPEPRMSAREWISPDAPATHAVTSAAPSPPPQPCSEPPRWDHPSASHPLLHQPSGVSRAPRSRSGTSPAHTTRAPICSLARPKSRPVPLPSPHRASTFADQPSHGTALSSARPHRSTTSSLASARTCASSRYLRADQRGTTGAGGGVRAEVQVGVQGGRAALARNATRATAEATGNGLEPSTSVPWRGHRGQATPRTSSPRRQQNLLPPSAEGVEDLGRAGEGEREMCLWAISKYFGD